MEHIEHLKYIKNTKHYAKSSIISACLGMLSCGWLLYKSKAAIELAMDRGSDVVQFSPGLIGYIPLGFALLGLSLAFLGFQKKQAYASTGFILNGVLFLSFYPFLLALSQPVFT